MLPLTLSGLGPITEFIISSLLLLKSLLFIFCQFLGFLSGLSSDGGIFFALLLPDGLLDSQPGLERSFLSSLGLEEGLSNLFPCR